MTIAEMTTTIGTLLQLSVGRCCVVTPGKGKRGIKCNRFFASKKEVKEV